LSEALKNKNNHIVSNNMFSHIFGIWLSFSIFATKNILENKSQDELRNLCYILTENFGFFNTNYYNKLLKLGLVSILSFLLKN